MGALDASQDREGHEIDSGGRSESDDEFDQDSVAIGNLAAAARAKLADQLLASGRADAAVEAAFRGVPRHTFLPEMDQIQLSVGLETARLTAALLGRTRERQTRGTGWPQFLWVILWVVLRGQRPARALRVEPAAVPAHLAQQRPALHTPNEHGHATEETTMRAAFADDPVQTQAAEAQSQARCDAPRQALAPAATPETLARLTRRPQRITGLLRWRARPRATYYDPVFGRPDLIDHFLFLERPEGMQGDDGSEFVETSSPRDPVDPRETLPRGQEYATIGHLYRGIADGLRNLSSRLGERAVFVGSPHVQATPELFRWPQLVSVTDLESALAAVETIIEQGEGALGDWETAHYGRFLSIRREFDAMLRADPAFEPARPALAAFLRQPFDIPTAQPLITDAEARRIAELAGLTYELILGVLLRVFTHTDESNAQLGTLLDAALALMAKVLQPLGTALTTLPVGSSYPGRTTGFAFEMHYVLGNMTPHREPAWALLAERARMLAHRCSQVAAEPSHHADLPAVTGEAAAHAHAIADALTAQVPAELRPEPGQAIRL